MQAGNEMEIFITLTKYNTCPQCEEDTHCLWWLLSEHIYLPPSFTIVSNLFMRNGTYPLMFIDKAYNKNRTYSVDLQEIKNHSQHVKRVTVYIFSCFIVISETLLTEPIANHRQNISLLNFLKKKKKKKKKGEEEEISEINRSTFFWPSWT